MTVLPRLSLDDLVSPFDEAVILIDGREEWTITIECENAREIAEQLVKLVNGCGGGSPGPQAPYRAGPGIILQEGDCP